MERDLADDLDELICAGYLNIDQDSLYNVAGLVFSVWVVVAILVYLAATYLVQSSAHKKESPKEIKEESVPQTVIPPEPQVAIASPEEKSVSAEDSIKFSAVVEKLDPLKTIGSDLEAVAWVNQCLDNIYSSSTLRATLIRQWLDALSRYIRSLDVEENVTLSYEGVLPSECRPNFTNAVTQLHPNDNMTMTLDVEIKDVPIKAKMSDGSSEIFLTLILKHLRGRASVAVLSRERVLNAKLEGWPEILLEMETSGRNEMDQEVIDIIKELSVSALRGSQININMEDFSGLDSNPFPVFLKRTTSTVDGIAQPTVGSPEKKRAPGMYPTLRKKAKRFLHVCVAKAVNLSTNAEIYPYVVTELDEPNQRHKTEATTLIGGTDAHWNQTFTFEISNMSKEVLFEVWNQSKEITKSETFLGLGIVSIDELMITQTQRLVVPLQGNPESFSDGNTAIFGGLLTVHFLLTQNEKTNEFPLDTNGHQVSPEDAIETVADTNGENPPIRSARMRNKKSDNQNRFKKRISASASLGRSASGTSITASSIGESASANVTPGTKRRSAMEKINNQLNHFITGIRAMSADRIRSASQNRGAASTLSKCTDDGEDSDSNLSGISSASNKTYITEESSLVLECKEKGVVKHYLIPYHLAKRGRIGKRGTKLHIYMDHIFVAQHIKSGTPCAACTTSIPLRIGKQGYVCRNCKLICHKPCHVKVTDHCMETTLPQMELLFIDGNKP